VWDVRVKTIKFDVTNFMSGTCQLSCWFEVCFSKGKQFYKKGIASSCANDDQDVILRKKW